MVNYDVGPGTGNNTLGGKIFAEGLNGDVGYTVDYVDDVPMHVAGNTKINIASLAKQGLNFSLLRKTPKRWFFSK
jgi:hypothetical protein